MPYYFKLTGGYFRGGKLWGSGEMYIEDSKTGEGEIYIGNFDKGKLNDPNGVYLSFNDNSFRKYKGGFIDHKMDGIITVYEYEDTSPMEDTDEHKGNGYNGTGVRFICACYDNSVLTGTKKNIIFSDGVEGSTISTESCNMIIKVEQKCLNGRNHFSKFCIEEQE